MADRPTEGPSGSVDAGRSERPIVCGDCLQAVGAEANSLAAQARLSGELAEWYCPHCVHPVRDSIECPSCGSAICPACGALLELADELGIG